MLKKNLSLEKIDCPAVPLSHVVGQRDSGTLMVYLILQISSIFDFFSEQHGLECRLPSTHPRLTLDSPSTCL